MTKLSIITVVKDDADGFRKTAANIMEQQGLHFKNEVEWIVVNGSTRSSAVAEEMAVCDDAISWSQSQPDKGIFNAMNIGIDHATGDFINFMNAGDCFSSEHVLHDVKETMDNHYNCDFLYGYWHRGERLCVPRRFDMNDKLPVASHQTMFFKRSVLGNQRYDERYKIASDFKFSAEYLKKAECPVMADFCVADFAAGGVSHRKFVKSAKESFAVRRELNSVSFAENFVWSTLGAAHGALRYYLPGVAHACQEGFKKLRTIGGRPAPMPVQHNGIR